MHNSKNWTQALRLALLASPMVLGGCGLVYHGTYTPHYRGPGHLTKAARQQAFASAVKGRAFIVGRVTMSAKLHPDSDHPFPNRIYARMLKWELTRAFKASGVEKGREPAVPVNVRISYLALTSGGLALVGPGTIRSVITLTTDGKSVVQKFLGSQMTSVGYGNLRAQSWEYARAAMPTMAVIVTRAMRAWQAGKRPHSWSQLSISKGSANNSYYLLPRWGLERMTPAQIIQASGVSKAQLKAWARKY
jgi:hypothetical protein